MVMYDTFLIITQEYDMNRPAQLTPHGSIGIVLFCILEDHDNVKQYEHRARGLSHSLLEQYETSLVIYPNIHQYEFGN